MVLQLIADFRLELKSLLQWQPKPDCILKGSIVSVLFPPGGDCERSLCADDAELILKVFFCRIVHLFNQLNHLYDPTLHCKIRCNHIRAQKELICDPSWQNESWGTFWVFSVMHAILFYVQLSSEWAIIHHNRPSTFGDRKFLNLRSAQYKLSGKRDFLWWMSYWP